MAIDLTTYKEIPLTGGPFNTATTYKASNGVVVTSSVSTYSNSNYYYLAYLFNNSPFGGATNYWLSSASGTAYMTFDFNSIGASYYPALVRIAPYTRSDSSSNYKVAISDDGVTWEEVTDWVYNTHGSGANYIEVGQYREHELPRAARYIRLQLTKNGSWGHTLNEVKFYRKDLEGKFLIEHGGELKKYVPLVPATPADVNIVPEMTSDTAPSGIARCSSAWDMSNYPPYRAFQESKDNYYHCWHTASGSVLPQWISYEFPTPKVIQAFSIQCRVSSADVGPGEFTIQGRKEGSTTFEIVKQFTQPYSGWPAGETRYFEMTENSKAYVEYRMHITKNPRGATGQQYMGIARWKMFEQGQPEIPARWDLFPNTDTSIDFISENGAELKDIVLYNRSLQQLTAIQPTTNEIVNPGGVAIRKTAAKISLNKLIDIREVT